MPAWMTGEAIWLWALYSGVLLLDGQAIWHLSLPGLHRPANLHASGRAAARSRASTDLRASTRTRRCPGLSTSWRRSAFSVVGLLVTYLLERDPAVARQPLQPAAFPQRAAVPGLEYRRQLHHQHQLAELRRRDHHELSDPDGRVSPSTTSPPPRPASSGRWPWCAAWRADRQEHRLFWVDLVRCIFYVLLPIMLLLRPLPGLAGCPDNFAAYTVAHTLEGATQTIAQGPVALQEAIKMLGTNGGGFFNANSAHPFENPTPLSNFIEMLSIFLIGSGLVYMFGKWVKNIKQGWAHLGSDVRPVHRRLLLLPSAPSRTATI